MDDLGDRILAERALLAPLVQRPVEALGVADRDGAVEALAAAASGSGSPVGVVDKSA
jgi:hypothetical protein